MTKLHHNGLGMRVDIQKKNVKTSCTHTNISLRSRGCVAVFFDFFCKPDCKGLNT